MSILKAKIIDLVVPASVALEGTEYGRPFEPGKLVFFRGIWWSAGECRRVLLFAPLSRICVVVMRSNFSPKHDIWWKGPYEMCMCAYVLCTCARCADCEKRKNLRTSNQARIPAEFKHITKRRKRN